MEPLPAALRRDNAINRLVRFTDLIEAGDGDGAVSELKSGIDAELLNY